VTDREDAVVEAVPPLLAGRYALRSLIASGGMGRIWRAWDTRLHRTVAVKLLRSEFTGDPTFLARFRAEAQHTAALAHRNIATLHDYGEVPDGPGGEHLAFLVMELVEGESLAALLDRERRLDVPHTLDVLRQTAAALAAAHAAGVVHRDVKPGNVLVGDDGVVKITDFGISWSAGSVPLTQTGQVVGTAHYLSPEQAEGGKASPASDVYALGMIAYECLAGRRAFDGESAVQIALRQIRDVPDPLPDDVPENVRRLVDRALAKDPARRLPDGAAFRDAVEDVLAGRTLDPLPAAPSTTEFDVPFPGRARRPRARALVPVAALIAGAVLGVGALQVVLPNAPALPEAHGESTTVLLVAEDYVGRPLADVEADLAARGLRTERVGQPSADLAAGLVLGIGPAGAVAPGETITVTYAVAPDPVADPSPAGGSPVSGPQPSAPVPQVDAVLPEVTDVDPPGAAVSGTGNDGQPGPGQNNGRRGEGNNGRGRGNT
jgi:serine/threonine-protein kinase